MSSFEQFFIQNRTTLVVLFAVALLIYAFGERSKNDERAPCPACPACPAPPTPPPPVCFPVAPASRSVPDVGGVTLLVNGNNNPGATPPEFVSLDAAIVALGAGPGTILIDGVVFNFNARAVAPSTALTGSVRITSVDPAVPAVICNTCNTTGTFNTLVFTSAAQDTIVIDNVFLLNGVMTPNLACIVVDGPQDVYVQNVILKTNAKGITVQNTLGAASGPQLQVQRCYFDGFLDYIPPGLINVYVQMTAWRGEVIVEDNEIVGQREVSSFTESYFVNVNAQLAGGSYVLRRNSTVVNEPLRFFCNDICGTTTSGNNRSYLYDNDVVCENFVYVNDAAYLDAFEFKAFKDNKIRSITMPLTNEQQYPMMLLFQLNGQAVVSNQCVLYARDNDYLQTSDWVSPPTRFTAASAPTPAWNVATPLVDAATLFCAYLDTSFTEYPLFPFADQVPCSSELARKIGSTRHVAARHRAEWKHVVASERPNRQ